MNDAEKKIAKRMIEEERFEAEFGGTKRERVRRLARRNALRELLDRFHRHAHRVKNARREKQDKAAESKK